jgi:hypothetical protein
VSSSPGSRELSSALRELLAPMAEGEVAADEMVAGHAGRRQQVGGPAVLARYYFLVEAAARDATSGLVRKGGVFLHEPTVALLLPSDFPPLARRRPDFAALRHVLVRFSFMLDRLPPRHSYESARLIVTLDDPAAVVRAQRPAWVTTDSESHTTVTTEFSAALNGLVRLGADRTRATETQKQAVRRPVITAENRGRAGFGWRYEAQDGVPLLPRIEFALAVVEMPASARQLSGALSAEAMITEPRFGVLRSTHAVPAEPNVPFRMELGSPGPSPA